jgi:hypothetical protein
VGIAVPMDAARRQELDELRKLPSHEAADLILERYPLDSSMWGNVITLIEHLSWKVPDQVRLAEYYLSRLPHASDRGYSVFLNMMQLERVLAVIERHWPQNTADVDLLLYYLRPVLKKASTNDRQATLVAEWLQKIEDRGRRD